MRKKDVIDIIYESHTNEQMKEKFVFLYDFINVVDQDNLWDMKENIKSILRFLGKHTSSHFRNEEILITMLKNYVSLSEDEKKFLEKIQQEHKIILEDFKQLYKLGINFDPQNKVIREQFVDMFHNLVEKIKLHAEEEDKMLYPLARNKLTAQQLEELEKKILQK